MWLLVQTSYMASWGDRKIDIGIFQCEIQLVRGVSWFPRVDLV